MGGGKDVISLSVASRESRGLTNGGGPPRGGRTQAPASGRDAGLTNGSGRTNGSGFTNGSGRTNGSGFTNGSGRTNGSGFTNGSGRTNGSRLRGSSFLSPVNRRAGRQRRRIAGAGAGVLLLTLISLGALGLGGEDPAAARVDGRFGDWAGRTAPVQGENAAGLVAVGLQPMKGAHALYLEFGALPEGRADVWVFLDADGSALTGYIDGAVGAEAAVRVSLDAGRVVAGSAFTFAGGDRFDASRLQSSGPAPAVAAGAALEVQIPLEPRALSVAVATPGTALSTGALTPTGKAAPSASPSLALSGALRNGIRIDGVFDDWAGVPLVSDPEDALLPARLDVRQVAAIGDGASAEFYLDTRGDVMQGTLPFRAEPLAAQSGGGGAATPPAPPRRVAGTDLLEIYLDTDLDALTGARVGALGAERLLRVEGVAGAVVLALFFEFKDGAWASTASPAEAAASGHALEVAVEAAGLTGARAGFTLTGFEGKSDTVEQPVTVGRTAGALAPDSGPAATLPQSRGEVLASPIPEFQEVAVVVALVGSMTLVFRRRRKGAPEEARTDG